MRRYFWVFVLVVLALLLSLTSCSQPQPYGTIKGVQEIYTLGSTVTIEWYTVNYEKANVPYEIVISTPDGSEITAPATEESYSFVPEEVGEYTVSLYGGEKDNQTLLDSVNFFVTSLEFVKPEDGEIIGGPTWDGTVTVVWKELSGAPVEYQYSFDGENWTDVDSTSVKLMGLSDGNYKFYLKIKGVDMPPLTRKFSVDTTPPQLYFIGGSREHQYLWDGDFDPNGRYEEFEWSSSEDVKYLLVRFYLFDTELGKRVGRINLVDNDGDGIYDNLKILSIASSTEHKWYYITTNPKYWVMVISDKEMYIPGFDVDETGASTFVGWTKVGFDVSNKLKLFVGFEAYDKVMNSTDPYLTAYQLVNLNERYETQNEPTLKIDRISAKVDQESSKLYIPITAENLKSYLSKEEHYSSETDKDTTFSSDLLYMQIPVVYSTNLTLSNVEWSNFWEGKKELNYYKVDDSASVANYTGGDVVYLYKGLVNGSDESEPVEDTVLATLVFDINNSSSSIANIRIWYEGDFTKYPNFKDIPNVILADNLGRQIDGVVVDNTAVLVPFEGGEK